RHAASPRREIGVRTVFNVLGPLTNPAGAGRQLLGVFSDRLGRPVAGGLPRPGRRRAGGGDGRGGRGGTPRFAPPPRVRASGGALREFDIDPAELGLAHQDRAGVAGGDAAANAARIRAVLGGEKGAARDIVLLNAGAALVVADVAPDLKAGVATAAATIDSGAARARLEQLQAFRG